MERRILLETLANRLPPESVHFSSKLAKIETYANGGTLLELMNGTRLHAKVMSNSQINFIAKKIFISNLVSGHVSTDCYWV